MIEKDILAEVSRKEKKLLAPQQPPNGSLAVAKALSWWRYEGYGLDRMAKQVSYAHRETVSKLITH